MNIKYEIKFTVMFAVSMVIGDLSAAERDWKNPVATVKIMRMK